VTPRLEELGAAFLGIVPGLIATSDAAGEPNVTYLSQIWYVDARHVALSCQFFNKTKRNVSENPQATVQFVDPRDYVAYKMRLRLVRVETSGPLFDTMAARIQVIASHSGMSGIFRLLSADIYEVESLEMLPDYRDSSVMLSPEEIRAIVEAPAGSLPPALNEVRGLSAISAGIARSTTLEELLGGTLAELDRLFSFSHSFVLVPADRARRLVAISSRGYGEEGAGAEVRFGAGVFGVAASERRLVRIAAVGEELRYGRAIRRELVGRGRKSELTPEIPLPGLPDARAQMGLPLLVGDRLVGVLGVESRDPLAFDDWDEAFLQIVASQIAMGIDRMSRAEDEEDGGEVSSAPPRAPLEAPDECTRKLRFVYYKNDEVIFVGDEYLIRNVPAKIFWKLLNQHQREGRTEFTNQELRLDASLGLPGYRDNLESRLILLKKRLVEKCPWVRMVPVRRGRFALEVETAVELVEKESA
jgi:hypothetical protein